MPGRSGVAGDKGRKLIFRGSGVVVFLTTDK